jgi:hypothetical protein
MLTATLTPTSAAPLDASHQREIAAAADQVKPIRRAIRVASFNAWSTLIVAVCSAPFALLSIDGYVVFAALAISAYNEFRGRRRLVDFDPSGATILGWNQLFLLAVITAYCLWAMYNGLTGENQIAAELANNEDVKAALGDVGVLYRQLTVLVYGSVIAISAIFQGGNAIYYFTRRAVVEDYLATTPEWLVDLQLATR